MYVSSSRAVRGVGSVTGGGCIRLLPAAAVRILEVNRWRGELYTYLGCRYRLEPRWRAMPEQLQSSIRFYSRGCPRHGLESV